MKGVDKILDGESQRSITIVRNNSEDKVGIEEEKVWIMGSTLCKR